MKRRYFHVIELMQKTPEITQRAIAKELHISLTYVNKILFSMEKEGFLEVGPLRLSKDLSNGIPILRKKTLTQKAHDAYNTCKVDNAIIMAAGFGSRFVPLTYATPKGLIEVFDERMIERQIKQLHRIGITDITVVVGYLKEAFEYLTDKYGVSLIYNPDYETKNNLSTLYHVREKLKNTFILSSDNWIRKNMYHSHEYDSWYSAIKVEGKTKEWKLQLGIHDKITKVKVGGTNGWVMYGPVYFSQAFSKKIIPLIEEAYHAEDSKTWYWEDVYIRNIKELTMFANKQPKHQIYEFESLEELKQFDSSYHLESNNKWLQIITEIFNTSEIAVHNIKPLKTGMTNQSFIFEIDRNQYIFRIPGKGTDVLINRTQEYAVYETIKPFSFSDNVIYFDPIKGIKITQFIENSRNADPNNPNDLNKCMRIARSLHTSGLHVNHEFSFRERINHYEDIANKKNAIFFYDYPEIRMKMNELLTLVDSLERPLVLTHNDLICDNFLFTDNETLLIDWEYAGMNDPLTDIAMFSIYSYFDQVKIDDLLSRYLQREPNHQEQLRVYSYVALAGFLWALWTEYKQAFGVSFGDYGLKMYRYAKDYYKIVTNLIAKENSL